MVFINIFTTEGLQISSTIIGKQKELGDGCQMIQALVCGLDTHFPQAFIDDELSDLLRKSEVLYTSDAPELVWILQREANKEANQAV